MSITTIATVTAISLFVAQEGEFDEDIVSPGVAGFVITGLVGLAVILLGFDLVRRLRRSRYRHEIRAQIEEELAERESGAADSEDGGSETVAAPPER